MGSKRNEHSEENIISGNDVSLKWIRAERITELYEKFPIVVPEVLPSMSCKTLIEKFGRDTIESNINSAYPVLHESVLKLYENFLQMNQNDDFYKNMRIAKFVNRLLKKRAVSFSIGNGQYLFFTDDLSDRAKKVYSSYEKQTAMTRDGTRCVMHSGSDNWKTIGTASEKSPLVRENCLTYDEIELSSFLSTSSFTVFINSGSRHNIGVYEENRENVQEKGIIIGLVGPQFIKPEVTEYKRLVCHETENKTDDNMDVLMTDFYACPDCKIIEIENKSPFHVTAYKKRLAVSFDTLLIEANSRAKEVSEMAFIHLIGIGLGIWRYCEEQISIFVDTFYERLEALGSHLSNVSDVRFAYIRVEASKKQKKVGKISIHFENIDPHIRIEKGKLLVVSYAWDGNALPGNLFWLGSLSDSSDPAAACSTQIAQLHNAHINEKVCGKNLRIASPDMGIVPYEEYLKVRKQKGKK